MQLQQADGTSVRHKCGRHGRCVRWYRWPNIRPPPRSVQEAFLHHNNHVCRTPVAYPIPSPASRASGLDSLPSRRTSRAVQASRARGTSWSRVSVRCSSVVPGSTGMTKLQCGGRQQQLRFAADEPLRLATTAHVVLSSSRCPVSGAAAPLHVLTVGDVLREYPKPRPEQLDRTSRLTKFGHLRILAWFDKLGFNINQLGRRSTKFGGYATNFDRIRPSLIDFGQIGLRSTSLARFRPSFG